MIASVPVEYVGVWRRVLLETPSVRDTTTRVFWLQTQTWHADIRIPADRPRFSAAGLAELDRDALLELSRQQGFAGLTSVTGDLCRWHRRIDYQPPSRFNDIGRMEFESPHRLLEYGVEQAYFEIWERMPEGAQACVLHFTDPNARSLLFQCGELVMRVRDRPQALPTSASFTALARELDTMQLRSALDLEISFGRLVDVTSWRIELSTLPWLEGEVCASEL